MNAKEIRDTIRSHANNHGPSSTEQSVAYWLSSSSQFLCEIAAQLAEQNEKLNILLNPPMMYDTAKVDFSEFENLSELHRPILTVTQPRATLRDQFAMAALAGLLSDPTSSGPKGCAKVAYEYADAIMEARK